MNAEDADYVLVTSNPRNEGKPSKLHLPSDDNPDAVACESRISHGPIRILPEEAPHLDLCQKCDPDVQRRDGKRPETLVASIVGEDAARDLMEASD